MGRDQRGDTGCSLPKPTPAWFAVDFLQPTDQDSASPDELDDAVAPRDSLCGRSRKVVALILCLGPGA